MELLHFPQVDAAVVKKVLAITSTCDWSGSTDLVDFEGEYSEIS